MKTLKILAFLFAALSGLMALGNLSWAQDALNQLNAQTSDQNGPTLSGHQDTVQSVPVVNTPVNATTPDVNDYSIKETMSPEEFKSFAGAKAYIDQNSKYTLGPDDEIGIVVMRHPEVSGIYTINQEGKIQYEFVGDVVVGGLTKDQATDALAKKLSVYIIKPEVHIKITGYNSKIVYVVGEVGAPGRIPMHGDTITVRDALLTAGLPLIGSAASDSASLFTPSASGKVLRKKVNVDALLYKGDLRQNYIMHPGDCLYVPATFLTKAMRVISPVTNPITQAAGASGSVKYGF